MLIAGNIFAKLQVQKISTVWDVHMYKLELRVHSAMVTIPVSLANL